MVQGTGTNHDRNALFRAKRNVGNQLEQQTSKPFGSFCATEKVGFSRCVVARIEAGFGNSDSPLNPLPATDRNFHAADVQRSRGGRN
jgi:hypothetical protein